MNFQNVEFLISAAAPKDFPGNRLPEIAFAGKSNVGKSSVINRILQRKNMAKVGDKPGKTIHINYFLLDKTCYLVDLPGYGFARRNPEEKRKWSALTDGYFTANPDSDLLKLVVQLIDSRIGPTADDRDMLSYLSQCGVPHIIAATKTDKLNATERRKFSEMIAECDEAAGAFATVMFSSKNGEGRDELWKHICTACGF